MRFLTYDELTPALETDRNLIHLASFGGAFPRRAIDLYRRRGKSFADYVAVFAVERGRLLGQTYVLRIPYTFSDGTELVSGIAGVGTRPDRGRSGVARAILTEVHRREREAGIRYSTLWTNRSWGAHNLYEELGYRDVYAFPWVAHGPTSGASRRPSGVRPARKSDLGDIERLHARRARGRRGFLREANGYLSVAMAARGLDPAKEFIVRRAGRRLEGYALVDANPYRTICGELVATSPAARRALIAEVQRRAKRTAFAFQHATVRDAPELFRDRGYTAVRTGWYGLTANALDRTWTRPVAVDRSGPTTPDSSAWRSTGSSGTGRRGPSEEGAPAAPVNLKDVGARRPDDAGVPRADPGGPVRLGRDAGRRARFRRVGRHRARVVPGRPAGRARPRSHRGGARGRPAPISRRAGTPWSSSSGGGCSRGRAGREVESATAERFWARVRASRQERTLPVFSDVRRCLDALRAEHRSLGIVSNSSSEASVRRILDRAGILDDFERVVSSGTEGVAKPNPEIFRRTVQRLGRPSGGGALRREPAADRRRRRGGRRACTPPG